MTPVNHPEEIVVGACHHNAAERKDLDCEQVSRFTRSSAVHEHCECSYSLEKKGTKRKRPMTVTKIDYRHSPVLPIPTTFKLIKNAVILIE